MNKPAFFSVLEKTLPLVDFWVADCDSLTIWGFIFTSFSSFQVHVCVAHRDLERSLGFIPILHYFSEMCTK